MPSGSVDAKDVDEPDTVQESVENSDGARYVSDQLTPVLQWSVARHDHHRTTMFVPAHDDLKQRLTGPLRQLLLHMASTISRSGLIQVSLQDFLCVRMR